MSELLRNRISQNLLKLDWTFYILQVSYYIIHKLYSIGENNMKQKLLLLIAVFFGIVAFVLTYQQL
ncbi:MAG: hypothetical protein PHV82_09350, partial [Victivallaceae bacterium]|nr:hypothetical protein [Victivallaceae bacterium]